MKINEKKAVGWDCLDPHLVKELYLAKKGEESPN